MCLGRKIEGPVTLIITSIRWGAKSPRQLLFCRGHHRAMNERSCVHTTAKRATMGLCNLPLTKTTIMSDDLDAALSKIRPHTTSSLEHQKTPATLLHALEATFDEQNTERSPTAYFAALLTTLDGTLQNEGPSRLSFGEGDILPAELYLLALVAPFVPQPVIRGNLNTILSLTLPLFPSLMTHAPPLRSQIGLYGSLLRALDRSQLEVQGVRQSFASILQLCLDARPKVRKRAAETVKDILLSPLPPLLRHPYSDRVAEWVKSTLADLSTNAFSRSKRVAPDMEAAEVALHLLVFLRPVILRLPPSVSGCLCLFCLVTLLSSPSRRSLPFSCHFLA